MFSAGDMFLFPLSGKISNNGTVYSWTRSSLLHSIKAKRIQGGRLMRFLLWGAKYTISGRTRKAMGENHAFLEKFTIKL